MSRKGLKLTIEPAGKVSLLTFEVANLAFHAVDASFQAVHRLTHGAEFPFILV